MQPRIPMRTPYRPMRTPYRASPPPRRPRARTAGSALALLVLLPGVVPAGMPARALEAQVAVRGGLSLSDLAGRGVETSDVRRGLTGGGGWTLLSLGPVELGPELHYVQKGTAALAFDAETGAPVTFEEFGIDYLEVPVMARLGFGLPVGGGALRGYASGGLAWAWRLQCTFRATGIESGTGSGTEGAVSGDGCAIPQLERFDDVIRSADRGTILGGGLVLRVGSFGNVTLDARQVRGLSRLARDPDDPEARNRAFLLTLGWDLSAF
jgi:hypothetical protein